LRFNADDGGVDDDDSAADDDKDDDDDDDDGKDGIDEVWVMIGWDIDADEGEVFFDEEEEGGKPTAPLFSLAYPAVYCCGASYSK
jgi:hypothetical protein